MPIESQESLKPHQHVATSNWTQRQADKLLALPRSLKRAILLAADYAMAIVSLYVAIAVRYGSMDNHIGMPALLVFALVPVVGLYLIGFYKGVARSFFVDTMGGVLQLFFVLIIIAQLVLYFEAIPSVPRAVPILFLSLLFIWLWNSRLLIRELLARWQGLRPNRNDEDAYDNVLIYGAGAAGKELLEGLRNSHKYNVVGFLDDDRQLANAYLLGRPIYAASDLLKLVDELDIAQIFIAIPSISRARKRQIINDLSDISIKIKELPSLEEIADEKVSVSSMHKVDILDVLDRQTVEPVAQLLARNINGKSVLVTGAGGSIGSELCRQIVKNQPKLLVLYELSEFALYSIHQELVNQQVKRQASDPQYQPIRIVAMIGNVTNDDKLLRLFKAHHIQTVYHAAAYKHVPIVESNPFEGVINNTLGTYRCVRAAIAAQVETFVLISTDKAVRPTNVMGASKRLAELVCQGFSQTSAAQHTCISMVRFGNVLGSSGSVVPLFTRQIEQGGPITVTHPEVTRYFMTIPEAANLVIQAGAMAKGGEVFVLDMGEPVKIVDLARRMIHLSGFEVKDDAHPQGDIEIVFSGLRPGEKLYEELIIGEDNVQATDHALIMQAVEHAYPLTELEAILLALADKAKEQDIDWLKQQLVHYVEGYNA